MTTFVDRQCKMYLYYQNCEISIKYNCPKNSCAVYRWNVRVSHCCSHQIQIIVFRYEVPGYCIFIPWCLSLLSIWWCCTREFALYCFATQFLLFTKLRGKACACKETELKSTKEKLQQRLRSLQWFALKKLWKFVFQKTLSLFSESVDVGNY